MKKISQLSESELREYLKKYGKECFHEPADSVRENMNRFGDVYDALNGLTARIGGSVEKLTLNVKKPNGFVSAVFDQLIVNDDTRAMFIVLAEKADMLEVIPTAGGQIAVAAQVNGVFDVEKADSESEA